jgi:hypothetical protein
MRFRNFTAANLLTSLVILCLAVACLVLLIFHGPAPK